MNRKSNRTAFSVLRLESCAAVLVLKLETGTVWLVGICRLETLFGLGFKAIDFSLDNTEFWDLSQLGIEGEEDGWSARRQKVKSMKQRTVAEKEKKNFMASFCGVC